jgi:hypothetical protein
MSTYTAYFNCIDGIELPYDVVHNCSHSGPCDEDVKRAMKLPEVQSELSKINPDQLIKELSEYGAWEPYQLANHNDNLERILWIAAGNIMNELNELDNKAETLH